MCALDAAYQSDICPRHCRARMWGKVTEEADARGMQDKSLLHRVEKFK